MSRSGRSLADRTIEDVADLPLMSDPESLATVDVLTKVVVPAFFTDRNLNSLAICRAVNLSLERGNCDASCLAYVTLGRIAGPHFGDYQAGFRFGQVGYELVERRGLKRFQASTYCIFAAWIARWMKHVRTSSDLQRRAFDAANKIGDLTFATYATVNLNSDLLVAGDPLSEVQREAELGLAFAQKARFGIVTDITIAQLALIRTLRGLTPKFGCFDSEQIEELPFERLLAGQPVFGTRTSAGTGSASCRRAILPATTRRPWKLHRRRSGCSGPHPPFLRRPNITFTAR